MEKLGEHAKKKHLSWVQNQDLHALSQHIAGVNRKLPERDKGHQFFKTGTCEMCFPELVVSRVPQDKNIVIVELWRCLWSKSDEPFTLLLVSGLITS